MDDISKGTIVEHDFSQMYFTSYVLPILETHLRLIVVLLFHCYNIQNVCTISTMTARCQNQYSRIQCLFVQE